jgi:peptide/nickel transport system ATP-binding protein
MLKLENVNIWFRTGSSLGWNRKIIRAVDSVDLEIPQGETLGLVGESGCGKSTLGRGILGLTPIESGNIYLDNQKIDNLSFREWLPYRKQIQVVFQDPYSSINPRLTIEEIISEGIKVHFPAWKNSEIRAECKNILEKVNLPSTALTRYPHEFSGGQRQRIAIARALVLRPKYLICDEAVSALDVSTQAQVLNLLIELRKEFGLSYLFISHDLGIVKYISDSIAVMYLGKIVERGKKTELVRNPKHPYTKALFDSNYDFRDRNRERIILKGEIPSAFDKPKGCHFHTRCPKVQEICRREEPPEFKISETHWGTCHFPGVSE